MEPRQRSKYLHGDVTDQRHPLRSVPRPLFPKEDEYWHKEAKAEAARWYKGFKQKKRESHRTYMFPTKEAGVAGITIIDPAGPDTSDLWQLLFHREASSRVAVVKAEMQWRTATLVAPRIHAVSVLVQKDENIQVQVKKQNAKLPACEHDQMMHRFSILEKQEAWFNTLTTAEDMALAEIKTRNREAAAVIRTESAHGMRQTLQQEAGGRRALEEAAEGWFEQLVGLHRAEQDIHLVREARHTSIKVQRHEDPVLRKELLEASQANAIVTTQGGNLRQDVYVTPGTYFKSKNRRLLSIEDHNRTTITLAQQKVFSEIFCQGHEQVLTRLRRGAKQKRRAIVEDLQDQVGVLQTLEEPSLRLRVETSALTYIRTIRVNFERTLEITRRAEATEAARRRDDCRPGTQLYFEKEVDKCVKMELQFRTQIESIVARWIRSFVEHYATEVEAKLSIMEGAAEKKQNESQRRLQKVEVDEMHRRGELTRGEEKWRGHLRLAMSHERMFPPQPAASTNVLVIDDTPPSSVFDTAPMGLLEDEESRYRSDLRTAEAKWWHTLFTVRHQEEKQDIIGLTPELQIVVDDLERQELGLRNDIEMAERGWRGRLLTPTAVRWKIPH